jgi:hypothetical protein
MTASLATPPSQRPIDGIVCRRAAGDAVVRAMGDGLTFDPALTHWHLMFPLGALEMRWTVEFNDIDSGYTVEWVPVTNAFDDEFCRTLETNFREQMQHRSRHGMPPQPNPVSLQHAIERHGAQLDVVYNTDASIAPPGVWTLLRWTQDAHDAIDDGKWTMLSPTTQRGYTATDGREWEGDSLIAVGLVDVPALDTIGSATDWLPWDTFAREFSQPAEGTETPEPQTFDPRAWANVDFDGVTLRHRRSLMASAPMLRGAELVKILNEGVDDKVDEGDKDRAGVVADLAEELGVDDTTVFQHLSGHINCPSASALRKYADFLDLPLDDVMAAAEADGCSPGTGLDTNAEPPQETDMTTRNAETEPDTRSEEEIAAEEAAAETGEAPPAEGPPVQRGDDAAGADDPEDEEEDEEAEEEEEPMEARSDEGDVLARARLVEEKRFEETVLRAVERQTLLSAQVPDAMAALRAGDIEGYNAMLGDYAPAAPVGRMGSAGAGEAPNAPAGAKTVKQLVAEARAVGGHPKDIYARYRAARDAQVN